MLELGAFLLVLACLSTSAEILYLRDGQDCRTLDGGYGNCVLLRSCENPGDFRVEHPPICSFKGKEPVICCPNSKTNLKEQPPGFHANEYCSLLQISHPGCFTPPPPVLEDTRDDTGPDITEEEIRNGYIHHPGSLGAIIYNGEVSKPRVRNYMVLIGYGPANEIEYRCGGSLIAPKYILSAAHCSQIFLLGPAKWARLGDLDIDTLTDDSSIQDREIVERIVYPEYKEKQVYHDIAVFRMDREVDYNPWVSPVCLYLQDTLPETTGTVSGWGRTEFAMGPSNQLLEADLDIFNDSHCQELHPWKNYRSPRGIDSDIMFCAGKIDGSKDACPGDSGGPLVIKNLGHCLRSQVGIVSYGDMCGLPDSPGVYTRVSHYVPWIESIVFQELEAISTSIVF